MWHEDDVIGHQLLRQTNYDAQRVFAARLQSVVETSGDVFRGGESDVSLCNSWTTWSHRPSTQLT